MPLYFQVVQPTQRWDGDVLSRTELRETFPKLESILTVPVTYRQTSEGTDRVRMLAQDRGLARYSVATPAVRLQSSAPR